MLYKPGQFSKDPREIKLSQNTIETVKILEKTDISEKEQSRKSQNKQKRFRVNNRFEKDRTNNK